MFARFVACLALCACARARLEPQAQIFVDVGPEEVEKRYTPELWEELGRVRGEADLLYTEYTGQAGGELRRFLGSVDSLALDALTTLNTTYENAPSPCRSEYRRRLNKITTDVHRAASFSAENHHKYFKGHMVVLRIHLNKSEEYVNKCQKVYKTCGVPCETTPRIRRWRRCALGELNRVKDDIVHSRRSYKDLLMHSRRRMNYFFKMAKEKTALATHNLDECVRKG